MRRAATLLIGLAPALAALPAASEIDRAAMIRLAPSVLKVEAVDAQGRFQLGSGVVVGAGTLVTNCHVTRRAARVSVVKGGVRWNAPAQSSDIGHDLCLLRVPGLDAAPPVAVVSSASLKVGQPLVAIGYTGGVGVQVSEGEVVALHELDAGRIIRSTNWFTSGASGGGLFTLDGALVGVLTFRLRGGAAHYFSAPADWLRERIGDEARFVALHPLDGSPFWERPVEHQPYFLQAASLEQGAAWEPLRELAERWVRAAPRDAEAAYMHAVADEGLGRDDDARRALLRCLALDANYVRGWERLARLHRRLGRSDDMRQAIDRLNGLDARLGSALAAELGNP